MAGDATRIFTGIAGSYDRVAAVLSLGQDPRWRRALVDVIDARPTDRVLDVATGTGMVAQALHDRFGCAVVGLDQSADMLRMARTRDGVFESIVEGRAEHLPFNSAAFDHLTFTYLLRYVDDPATTMCELARVVKPGGRVAMVEFGVPGVSLDDAGQVGAEHVPHAQGVNARELEGPGRAGVRAWRSTWS